MNSEHKERWLAALEKTRAIRSNNNINSDFGASLYIITSMPDLWDKANTHTYMGWIDYEALIDSEVLSSGEKIMLSLAGNLYNGRSYSDFTLYDIITHCDKKLINIAVTAIVMRTQSLTIDDIDRFFEKEMVIKL